MIGSKDKLLLGQNEKLELPKEGQGAEILPDLWSCCA